MAKSLRSKLAMALCCTVAMGTTVQAAPVLAEENTLETAAVEIGTESTTGSSLTINGAEKEETEIIDTMIHTTVSVEDKEDAWEEIAAAANLFGDIKVLKADSDEASMAADFFKVDELPIEIRDGKVYLSLKISKDGLGVKNAITSMEQKIDGVYSEVELAGLEDEKVRYVTAEICMEDMINGSILKCGIDTGFMVMKQELRIVFEEETIDKVQAELEKEDKEDIEVTVEDGTYLVNLDILHAVNDEPSHSASSFVQENVKLTVKDGRGYLTLAVKRDMGAMKDVIGGLEQKVNGIYEPLDLIYTEVSEERVVAAELELDELDELALVRMDIQTPVFIHSAEVRIGLKEESLKALQQGESQEITPVEIIVSHLDATEGKADGSITISAEGGSGVYEYSIDGGANWVSENQFNDLATDTYRVVARDAQDKMNVSSVQRVTLKENGIFTFEDGSYLVSLDILHATNDEPSHSAGSFIQEDVKLTVKDGKGYLTLAVKRDMGAMKDVIGGLEQKVNEIYKPLERIYTEADGERIVLAELELEQLQELMLVKMDIQTPVFIHSAEVRIGLTQESLKALRQGESTRVTSVKMAVNYLDAAKGKSNGSITVTATDGNGTYEYSIDGGESWTSEYKFAGLAAGTYKVVARDADYKVNVSAVQEITLKEKESSSSGSDSGSLANGYYSVDVEVLQESSDEESMAAQFFKKEGLPLRISNGKAYLTVQVLKDGMGMKDVITSLEQKVNGNYESLNLNYLSDSSKRYVTAEIEFDSIENEAYLRCGIAPMGNMKPVLRIRLDENSIQSGAGSIDTELKPETSTSISSVKAENGKVTITLESADETLTADDFTGKVYLDGSSSGKALTLKDFKMEDKTVSFTFDKLAQVETKQTAQIGITLNSIETKSNEFTVKGVSESVSEIGLKEEAKEIKYIVGYEDGTFRANNQVTNAELVAMLADLIDAPAVKYYSANIDVLQGEKDEASMAKQFFKTEGIKIKEQAGKYFVELEISNEGLGFTDIITGVQQKINGAYQTIEVHKSSDLKTAYVTLEVNKLSDAITLKTGIAPMGSVAPELRIVISQVSEKAYETAFGDIEMWAKEDIMLFESFGLIGGNGQTAFNPNTAITRGECIRLIALTAGLDIDTSNEHSFEDVKDHEYEVYIAAAYKAGLVKGYEGGNFRPDQTLTRAEAVAMINRFIGHDGSTHVEMENPFSDLKTSHWAYKEILKVVEA